MSGFWGTRESVTAEVGNDGTEAVRWESFDCAQGHSAKAARSVVLGPLRRQGEKQFSYSVQTPIRKGPQYSEYRCWC